MIRITGGEYRSRLLLTPDTELTKPTMDKVRAAVFSALSLDKMDKVLDLFSGSGSYGFEALSRGAKEVYFVDRSPKAIDVIKKNAKSLNIENINIILSDVVSYLKTCDGKFNIIFVDPPYKLEVYEEVVSLIIKRDLLTSNGIIVLEADKELNLDLSVFKKVKDYKYGLTRIYILRK